MNGPVVVPAQPGTAVPWRQARALAYRLPVPLGAVPLPLAEAVGRALAAPVRAACRLPGFDNAAMDGYAIRGPGPWRLIGRVLAGDPAPAPLVPGSAVEIATGAVVPPGTDRVLPYETSARDGDLVSASPGDLGSAALGSPPGLRPHIRRAGEYAEAGQEVLPAGRVLTAAGVGLAASAGVDMVTVRARPTVRILVTGDEVVAGGLPAPGMVRDAIGPLLAPLLRAWGGDPAEVQWVPDQPPDALAAAIATAATGTPAAAALDRGTRSSTGIPEGNEYSSQVCRSTRDADVTVICGSSSVGPADRLGAALDTLGAVVHVDGVHCRPGHPQLLAQVEDRWLVGVPGNPFAALAAAFTLLEPLLAGLGGRELRPSPVALLSGGPAPPDRPAGPTRLVPVRWHDGEVHVVPGGRPGYLGAAALADALAVVPPTWRPGEPVELLAFPA